MYPAAVAACSICRTLSGHNSSMGRIRINSKPDFRASGSSEAKSPIGRDARTQSS
jgi:hypothetical protein